MVKILKTKDRRLLYSALAIIASFFGLLYIAAFFSPTLVAQSYAFWLLPAGSLALGLFSLTVRPLLVGKVRFFRPLIYLIAIVYGIEVAAQMMFSNPNDVDLFLLIKRLLISVGLFLSAFGVRQSGQETTR